MNSYWFDDINAAADCADICRAHGLHENGPGRFESPHGTSGKSTALSVKRSQWFDHHGEEKRGGGPIELVEYLRNCSTAEAMDWLGNHYKLTPFKIQESNPDRRIVKTYDYTDPDTGELRHQTVRFDPKDFAQRRPSDGSNGKKWIWNLKDIEPILYRIADWRESAWVCNVGGEKDADNLLAIGIPATTNPMGEGHWRDSYNKWLAGKQVVIIPDNDDAGEIHRKTVMHSCRSVVAGIRTLRLPNLPDKGDVSDWLAAGGTADQLRALLKDLPQEDLTDLPAVDETDKAILDRITKARKANTRPFRNYLWIVVGEGADKKRSKEPIPCRSLVKDVRERFLDFPVTLGEQLVDWDRDRNRLHVIRTPSELTSWMRMTGGIEVDLSKESGMVTSAELMSALSTSATRYEAVSHTPHWPLRSDTLYTYQHSVRFPGWPKPDPDMTALCQLCSMLGPHEPADDDLMQILFAAPLYYRPGVQRPSWIIDAITGQGSGKSTVAEMVAYLYECPPIVIPADQIRADQMGDKLIRRILTERGRQSRVAMIDNIDQAGFKSASIASMITLDTLSGLRPYGSSEEFRPNDLTWLLTMNTAAIDEDLADRSLCLTIRREPGPRRQTVTDIRAFIDANRWQILADIIAKLDSGAPWKVVPALRNQEFEVEVMAPMVGDPDRHSEVIKAVLQRRGEANTDLSDAETIEAYIADRLEDMGIPVGPEAQPVWITSPVLQRWCGEAVHGFGGATGRGTTRILTMWIKRGTITALSRDIAKWPGSARRGHHRGMIFWLGSGGHADAMRTAIDPTIVKLDHKSQTIKKERTSEQ